MSLHQRTRSLLAAAAASLATLAWLLSGTNLTPSTAIAQDERRAASVDPLTETKVVERVTVALDKSIAYLAQQQQPNGSWHTNQAVNGVTILSFLGRGHVPGRGPYAEVLERAKLNLLRSQTANGVLGATMYEHGIATLACAELYGMDPDPKLEEGLRKAVDLIIKSQSPSGGWRYNPTPGDQDLSVTVMQVVALRAANNAEIPVSAQTFEKAIAYVRSCASPSGGYGYTGPGQSPQTTAGGIISLQLLGQYNDPHIPVSLDFLDKIPIEWKANAVTYFYYYHYYSMQAHYQAGGKYWNDWHPRIRELLLEKQNPDGSWDMPPGSAEGPGVVGPNRVYWTAMASLVLEVYMHFLPAYQR